MTTLSGITLQLVREALQPYQLRSMGLYLGRRKVDQQLDNIASEFRPVFLAEDYLAHTQREQAEAEFARFFACGSLSCLFETCRFSPACQGHATS